MSQSYWQRGVRPITIPDYNHVHHVDQRDLATLSELCRWISHTADPDLPPKPHIDLHDTFELRFSKPSHSSLRRSATSPPLQR